MDGDCICSCHSLSTFNYDHELKKNKGKILTKPNDYFDMDEYKDAFNTTSPYWDMFRILSVKKPKPEKEDGDDGNEESFQPPLSSSSSSSPPHPSSEIYSLGILENKPVLIPPTNQMCFAQLCKHNPVLLTSYDAHSLYFSTSSSKCKFCVHTSEKTSIQEINLSKNIKSFYIYSLYSCELSKIGNIIFHNVSVCIGLEKIIRFLLRMMVEKNEQSYLTI
jgi:hypothetical protein